MAIAEPLLRRPVAPDRVRGHAWDQDHDLGLHTKAESVDCDEKELQTLNVLRSILWQLRAIALEQQRQAHRLTVQGRQLTTHGRAIREVLAIVRRLEHPPQQPHVPTTMVVTFGPPMAE